MVIDPGQQHDLDGSRGTANFCMKWDRGARHQAYLNVQEVKGVTRALTGDDAGKVGCCGRGEGWQGLGPY